MPAQHERAAATLAGRVAIVTGASSGLGRAVAARLAEAGAAVVAVARREGPLAELSNAITASGGRCIPLAGDAGDPATAERALAAALQHFGSIDILVNNAGIGNYKQFVDTSLAEYDEMMHANLRSGFVFSHAVAPHLIAQRSGDIVFISSVAGLTGVANEVVYCASKFAQVGMATALSEELAPYGVKVCALCPGGMKTGFALERGRTTESIAQSTMMDAEDTAAAVLFACTQPANLRVTQMTVRHMGKQR